MLLLQGTRDIYQDFVKDEKMSENRLKRGSSNMMANIGSRFETEEAYENYDDLYGEQDQIFKQLDEFRVSNHLYSV